MVHFFSSPFTSTTLDLCSRTFLLHFYCSPAWYWLNLQPVNSSPQDSSDFLPSIGLCSFTSMIIREFRNHDGDLLDPLIAPDFLDAFFMTNGPFQSRLYTLTLGQILIPSHLHDCKFTVMPLKTPDLFGCNWDLNLAPLSTSDPATWKNTLSTLFFLTSNPIYIHLIYIPGNMLSGCYPVDPVPCEIPATWAQLQSFDSCCCLVSHQ